MQSAKPFTNRTFTKRVDHDGGRHRPPRAPAEPAVCPGCGAVYVRRRWSRAPVARLQAARLAAPVTVRICAACRRRQSGIPHGYLHVDGDFFAAHRGEIEPLLRNEVERARADNPLHQILAWSDLEGGGLLIATATEHLAQRLGHALEKAYDGRVRYGFSHENKLAHVWWRR
ncbi:MAG: ATPase [Acidobacteria bacterium]|nr:ATPase [Acidobacteriota bacterium]